MPTFKVDLTDDQVKVLLDLAGKRNTDPNTVLRQAIDTETLIAENVGKDDELLIKRADQSYSKFTFSK